MNTVLMLEDWQAVGQTPAPTLFDARLQLHWAAQIAASVGYTLVDPTPDWSHTTLDWLDDLGATASQPTPGSPSFRAALRLADMTLLFLDESPGIQDSFSLDGRTLDDGYTWLASTLAARTGARPDLQRAEEGLPDHPVAHGAAFSLETPDAFAELSRWYANAHHALTPLQSESPGTPSIRTWPHHLDMAMLLEFAPTSPSEEARSIGVGFVPGDEGYAEPYWYITPWPATPPTPLPLLQGEGHWHTDGWFGAVLTASRIAAAGDASTQAKRTQDFIRSAITHSYGLIGVANPSDNS